MRAHYGPHATPKPATNGPVFLGIKNVTDDGHLDLSETRHIAEEDFAEWTRRVEPRPGDVVFTYEATLNRYAIIPVWFPRLPWSPDGAHPPQTSRCVNTRFLHFYFFTPAWRDVVRQHTLSGATVDRLPLTTFPNFPVKIPRLSEQRRIAGILSAYDDLIENCERVCACSKRWHAPSTASGSCCTATRQRESRPWWRRPLDGFRRDGACVTWGRLCSCITARRSKQRTARGCGSSVRVQWSGWVAQRKTCTWVLASSWAAKATLGACSGARPTTLSLTPPTTSPRNCLYGLSSSTCKGRISSTGTPLFRA